MTFESSWSVLVHRHAVIGFHFISFKLWQRKVTKQQQHNKSFTVMEDTSTISNSYRITTHTKILSFPKDFRAKYLRKAPIHSDVAGPNGQIWRCKDRHIGKDRSLKIIPKSKTSRLAFLQETTILTECTGHPNLLGIQDVYEDDKRYFFVTDDVGHPTLTEAMAERKSSMEEIGAVIRTLVKSLLFLHDPNSANKSHKKEIVHGNIHSKTVLVPKDASSLCNFLLVDFSAAHMDLDLDEAEFMDQVGDIDIDIDEENNDSSSDSDTGKKDTTRKKRKRKSQFDAPELSEAGPTVKTDIWALGILSFLLLTGRYPFKRPADTKGGIKEWYSIRSPKIQIFIENLLAYNPDDRPTAVQINEQYQEKHLEADFSGYEADLEDVMGRLTELNKEYAFKKAVRSYIASNLLQESNQERLGQIFRLSDKNNDNLFCKEEFQQALQKAEINIPPKKVEHYFSNLDANGDSSVDYTEFMAFAAQEEILFEKQKLKAAFDAFDWSNTGAITADDLKQFSASAGGATAFSGEKILNHRTIQAMIQEVDKNGDGQINFDEFCDMIAKKSFTSVFSW